MRLLIVNVLEDGADVRFKKVALIRLPVRLGQEVFAKRTISSETRERFLEGMRAFYYLLRVHGVTHFRAFATSAMREAKNSQELVDQVQDLTGIEIGVIDGKTEANIIFSGHFQEQLEPDSNYVYVDVGGGSTEITILHQGDVQASRSFRLGTLRMLNGMAQEDEWKQMKTWIKTQTGGLDHVEMIGSGGNINKLYKLSDKKYPRPLLYHELKAIKNQLAALTFEARIKQYGLNPDRADVIVPAAEIYFSVMKWSDCSILHVPKIGLADGVIMELYREYQAGVNRQK
ncbi:MAG: exopolyphosphatase [Leptolyngbya sp. SIO3F4]|nr:exopolyphosphatase [Leptolyngbya sp. SIO3F4]